MLQTLFPKRCPVDLIDREVSLKDKTADRTRKTSTSSCILDDHGHVIDFSALEVQAVYIFGRRRRPLHVSSSRRRRIPQMNNVQKLDYPGADLPFVVRSGFSHAIALRRRDHRWWRRKSALLPLTLASSERSEGDPYII